MDRNARPPAPTGILPAIDTNDTHAAHMLPASTGLSPTIDASDMHARDRTRHRQHDTTRRDTARHDTTQHDTTRHDTTRHDTARHSSVFVRREGVTV